MKYNINDHAKAFLEENLPEALAAESSFEALKMLYELIDEIAEELKEQNK